MIIIPELNGVIDISKNFKNYNFLIKPHPAEKRYNCSTKDLFRNKKNESKY